jgi:hypothetical protein
MSNNLTEWKIIVGRMIIAKYNVKKADVLNLWPHHLPELAATNGEIKFVEKSIGAPLGLDFAGFLGCANGWLGFYQSIDLFSCCDLTSGPRYQRGKGLFERVAPDAHKAAGVNLENSLVIGASRDNADHFILGKCGSSMENKVLWFADEEIERFDTFKAFFLAMIAYNEREALLLRASASN